MLEADDDTSMSNTTMYIHDYEALLMQYSEYRAKKNILLYVPPILLTVGTVGNLFSFLILRQSMSRVSTYFYLAILSLADIFVLYIGLLRLWTGELTGYDVKKEHDWICKFIVTIGYTFSDFSVWLIVAVTVERYIAVCHPLKASILCSVQKAKAITVVLLFATIALNLHFLWTVELSYTFFSNTSSDASCGAVEKYEYLVNTVWPWVDAAVYSLFPCTLLAGLNCLIIRQVFLARQVRNQLQNCKSGRNNHLQKRLPSEVTIKLTIMLLTVSFSFMLTTLPSNILLIVSSFSVRSSEDPYHQIAKEALAESVTELLMYVNHSMNFFLYCATGNKFRKSIQKLVCKLKHYRRSLDQSSPNSMLLTRVSFSGGHHLSIHNTNNDVRPVRRSTTEV